MTHPTSDSFSAASQTGAALHPASSETPHPSSAPIVLAYSGGLDTSVAVGWLKESTGRDVVAVAIDCGQGEDMGPIKERALACGASASLVIDAKADFAANYCMPAVAANALYMGQYPLVSALSRPLIVQHLADVAAQYGAGAVSHGCTGKGNDQVRFEVGLAALAPQLEVIAPVRDFAWTREKSIEWANAHDLPIDVSKKSPYSIDQNLWGRAVETGFLEDPWNAPIEDVYSYTDSPTSGAAPDELVITFTQGVPTAIDGQPVTPLEAVEQLNRRAGAQGVGRLDMIEDRLVGIKSREVYECPGAIALITAHQALENLTLERETARFKRGVDQRWAELAYDGLWFSPLMSALNAFIAETQRHVTGDVRLRLHAGSAVVTGSRSTESLYDFGLATYDEGDTFDQSLAKGFISLWGLPTQLAAERERATGHGTSDVAAAATPLDPATPAVQPQGLA